MLPAQTPPRRVRRGVSPPDRGRSRRLRAAVAGATALALLLTGSAASASPGTAADPSGLASATTPYGTLTASQLAELGSRGNGVVELTLITGDRVRVSLADGRPVVRGIVPAHRDGGPDVAFYTLTRGDRVYVVPSDAAGLVAQDVLDLELFNLAELAELAAHGTVGEVPVIVTHERRVTARVGSSPVDGATVERILPSIQATAQRIDGDGTWWEQVRPEDESAEPEALAGVEKIWLNGLATLELADSVSQINAPQAWAKGFDGTGVRVAVLDTGIDPNHPDVADRIIAQEDFTGNPAGPRDGHGHGTHVAATIAGTGAASDGQRVGVAPGAELLIGKICGDSGSCAFDAIIAGMEWAALSGAQVVNMSIGGNASDGTDPMSLAVNQLSELTGALFVIAAGNAGPDRETVATPGAADAALTVAAVDRNNQMATFSSRGPRLGDGAAKPDIAAPGVGIVAARAEGTAMGVVVDDHYTAASGTSMATPHVAGAAAIVLQSNPALTGQQVKAWLIDTANDLGHDEYAQGAGLVDVGRAVDSALISSGQIQFGRLTFPHQPVSRPLTYTNLSDQSVTLSLAASMVTATGVPAPAGLVSLDRDQITVPAGESVTVTVTLDGRVLSDIREFGRYRGAVAATDETGEVRSRVRLGAFLEPERHRVTVEVTPPADARDVAYSPAWLVPMDDLDHLHDQPVPRTGGPTYTADLFPGVYAAAVTATWRDAAGRPHSAMVFEPEVTVSDKPVTVTVDLRKAKSAVPTVGGETQTYYHDLAMRSTSATGAWSLEGLLTAQYTSGRGEPNWWTLETDKPRTGTFEYRNQATLVPPLVTMRAVGGGGSPIDLDPRYVAVDYSVAGDWQSARNGDSRQETPVVLRFNNKGNLSVVYAGTGTDVELAAAQPKGKAVLIRAVDICHDVCDYAALKARVARAAAYGAVGVLVAAEAGRPVLGQPQINDGTTCGETLDECPDPGPYMALPVVAVPAEPALALAERLERKKNVHLQLGGEPVVSTVYAVGFYDERVPKLPHALKQKDFDRVRHQLHSSGPGLIPAGGFEWARSVPGIRVNQEIAIYLPGVALPSTLTMLVGPRRADTIERMRIAPIEYSGPYEVRKPDFLAPVPLWSWPTEMREVALNGRDLELTWNSGPSVPGAIPPTVVKDHRVDWLWCVGCREGDRFWPLFHFTGNDGVQRSRMVGVNNDTGAGMLLFGGIGCDQPTCTITLYDSRGNELPQRLVPISFGVGGTGSGVHAGTGR